MGHMSGQRTTRAMIEGAAGTVNRGLEQAGSTERFVPGRRYDYWAIDRFQVTKGGDWELLSTMTAGLGARECYEILRGMGEALWAARHGGTA